LGEGELYLVSTPIGNLKDITLRALEVLKEVDVILCEDTRRTRKLLSHYRIRGKLLSFYSHNQERRIPQVIELLKEGKKVALVSDSGTPGISDPGFYLVKKAIEESIKVIPIPGPTALISALTVSGLPTQRFTFYGFLPSTGKMRRRLLKKIKEREETIIFFLSPHKVLKSLEDIYQILGDRQVSLVREITKIHEEVIRDKVSSLMTHLKVNPHKLKGEMVLALEGKK